MATPAQVTWAKADDSRRTLVAIGGRRKSFFGRSEWALSAEEAIALIEQDEWRFFVDDEDQQVWLEVDEDDSGSKALRATGPIRRLLQ